MDDISTLKEEEETYAGAWRQRKEAFDAIVQSLETMGEALRWAHSALWKCCASFADALLFIFPPHSDEKAEQERRRALDEDDNEAGQDGAALDPNAKPFEPAATGSGAATPQVASGAATPAAVAAGDAMEGVEQEEGEEREEGETTS